MKEKIKKQNKHSLRKFFSRSLRHLSSVCWAGSNTKSLICQSPTSAGTGATAGHWEHWSTAVHRVCVCVCVCFKTVEVVFSINVMLYVLFKNPWCTWEKVELIIAVSSQLLCVCVCKLLLLTVLVLCDIRRPVSRLGDLGSGETSGECHWSHAAGWRVAGHPAG